MRHGKLSCLDRILQIHLIAGDPVQHGGGTDKCPLIIMRGIRHRAAIRFNPIEHLAVSIRQHRFAPAVNSGCRLQIMRVLRDLVQEHRRFGCREVNAGVLRDMLAVQPPQTAVRKFVIPLGIVYKIKVIFRLVQVAGFPGDLISSCAGHRPPHDVIVKRIIRPVLAIFKNGAVKNIVDLGAKLRLQFQVRGAKISVHDHFP
ncbi:hypothetical protein D3C81_1139170 [compost metagenome]